MSDLMSFITLAGVVAVALIQFTYMRHQSNSLKATAQAMDDINSVMVKNRRDAHKQLPFTMKPFEWVAKQLDSEAKPIEVISTSQKPAWVNFRCEDGKRVVVSPLSHLELKSVLKAKRSNSKLEQAVEPLLGMSKKNLAVSERSLRDHEWFDQEAENIGKQCGVEWGEVTRLYFYTITPKETK